MLTRLFFVGNKWNCVFFFRGGASSLGGDASPRRHLLVKARCLDKQIKMYFIGKLGPRAPTCQCRRGPRRPPVSLRLQHLTARARITLQRYYLNAVLNKN